MSRHPARELNWAEPWLFGASLLVLAVCTVYALVGLHRPKAVPWQATTWEVVLADEDCGQPVCLQPGDQVTRVGGVTLDAFRSTPSLALYPFADQEKRVEVTFVRAGDVLRTTYDWHQDPFSKEIESILTATVPLVLWILGTLTILLVRPRDVRWLVLTSFYYVAAVFVAAGLVSSTHQLYSVYVVHVAAGLLLPLVVHVHLILPSRAFPRLARVLVPLLWLCALAYLVNDVVQNFPFVPMWTLLGVTLVLTAAVFAARFRRKAKPAVRRAERLILAGWIVGLGPLVVLITLRSLELFPPLPEPLQQLLYALVLLVFLPLWPLSYLWAIYRADLGRIEIRANRALGAYGFWCSYLTAYVAAFLLLASYSDWFGDNTLLAGLFVSVVFVAGAPWLRSRFQHWVDTRLFGIRVPPERLPLDFASKIPAAFDRHQMRRILLEETLPSLLVRQSSLLLLKGPSEGPSDGRADGRSAEPLYLQGLTEDELPLDALLLEELAESAGSPRKTQADEPAATRWVRLVVLLESRKERFGYWLFGRRDPEDAYPRSDIEVLRSVANQITAVLRARTEIERRRRLQDQLIQSQKMEAIGRLSAGVAHDFNNLLSAILGYSDLLLGTDPDTLGRQRSFVEGIKEAGEKAAALTNQLLAFSRQQVMASRVMDLNDVVGQLENLLRRVIEEDIELKTDLDEGPLLVRIDPGQMEQVLLNLVVNACDAMGDGGHLEIRTSRVRSSEESPSHPDVPPGEYVTLSVRDDGSGIAPEVRDRIFEPFFTTKIPGQGTGLGLAMVYGIVNQSRGYIAVDSEVGVGTSFTLYLPRTRSAPTPLPPRKPERRAASGPETILLVEDEASVRKVVREILRSRGYTVLTANDGRMALQVADDHDGPIDLLLTDVMMPHIKGPELADRLVHRRPAVKVIFMSGYNEEEILGERLRTGDSVLLRKPFPPEELAREIRKALDGERVAGTTGSPA